MSARLARIILYVQDVERLSAFYQEAFGLTPVEVIAGEWAVLRSGSFELALHRVGAAYRNDGARSGEASNAKLVFVVDKPVAELREALVARGIAMRPIKQYAATGRLCDGEDPEGNVFQLAEDLSQR